MTRTGHFFSVVLFLITILFAVYALKRVGLISQSGSPTYEGFAALSGGAIAGIVLGVVAGVIILYILYRRFFGGSSTVTSSVSYAANNRRVNNRGFNNRGTTNY